LIIIIPVVKNKTYKAEIIAISSDGNGIAKISGYTLFVPQTVPGDICELLILKTKSNYGYAKSVKLIKSSPYRVNPKCEHFSKCGGCQLMMADYKEQLNFKKSFVHDSLERIGGINKNIDIIGMDEPFYYRNKMVFPFLPDGSWGFYRERSHDVVPLNDCLLGDKLNKDIMNTITAFIRKYNISVYDETEHKGIMRRAFIRNTEKESLVVISVNSDNLPKSEELIKMLSSLSNKIIGIVLNINKKRTNLVLGDKNILLWGKDTLSANLCGLNYKISPESFFQINPIQTEKLYSTAIDYADIKNTDTVLDIYCGIGTISLTASKYAKSAIGIEIVEKAIENAKSNAIKNNIKNAEFYASAAEELVPKLIKDGLSPDIVILDPPRKGSDEATLSSIVSANPKRIVYVSCNPATLARDAKYLVDNGYKVEKVTAVDMFPHTVHVESVMLLIK